MKCKKHIRLDQSQLNQVAKLAKTKTIKEVAAYFNMSKHTFQIIRKQQPEIDQIYYENHKQKNVKIYTESEILEIEQLAETLSVEDIAKHFGTSVYHFSKARKEQPELAKALMQGIENRSGNFNYRQKQKRKAVKQKASKKAEIASTIEVSESDSLENRAPDNISTEEALQRFYHLRHVAKQKQSRKELRELYW